MELKETIEKMIKTHLTGNNTFTFPTRESNSAYTFVSRDDSGDVQELVETRELGIQKPQPGERDIGLFIFKKHFLIVKFDVSIKIESFVIFKGEIFLL